jgi:hypothetical protein
VQPENERQKCGLKNVGQQVRAAGEKLELHSKCGGNMGLPASLLFSMACIVAFSTIRWTINNS